MKGMKNTSNPAVKALYSFFTLNHPTYATKPGNKPFAAAYKGRSFGKFQKIILIRRKEALVSDGRLFMRRPNASNLKSKS
jgi:hypothetical protein